MTFGSLVAVCTPAWSCHADRVQSVRCSDLSYYHSGHIISIAGEYAFAAANFPADLSTITATAAPEGLRDPETLGPADRCPAGSGTSLA
jgi:hypothetical protein